MRCMVGWLPVVLAVGTGTGAAGAAAPGEVADPAGRVLGQVLAGGEAVGYAEVAVRGYALRASADEEGRYMLTGLAPGRYTLLVSALGYGTAEVDVEVVAGEAVRRDVQLERRALDLNPVVVTATRKRTFVSESPVKVEVVPGRYLQTMGASSLVESIQQVNGLYEQVDCAVCYTNNIRINGMEGPYTSVLIDGMPIMSSLASVYGLNGINPALIERIEIIKGPSSTLYGSDAMAGVINVILKDPRFAPRYSVDMQVTDHGATRADFAVAPGTGAVSGLVSGSVYRLGRFLDENGDGFADLSMDTRLTLFGKLRAGQASPLTLTVKYYWEDRFGGERGWTKSHRGSSEVYGESIYTNRYELLGSWVLPIPDENVRLEFSWTDHAQDAYYADARYLADQQIGVAQLLWGGNVGLRHDLLVGAGAEYEVFDDATPATEEPVRRVTPGVFVQDEYAAAETVKLLGGLRLDHHRDHGLILSPRASVKVQPFHDTAIRLNAGTGFRVVDLFTEDYAALVHTRRLVTARDLAPERSYSLTLNVNQVLDLKDNPMMVDLDAFYTYYTNRIIPDYDTDPGRIIYHNLDGFGVSRGVGVSLNQNFGSDLPLLYTLGLTVQDVFYEDGGVRQDELFAADFKGVWSVSYTFAGPGVTLDYTGTVVGPMRLPAYDAPYTRPTRSETYALHNVMATWSVGNGGELYAGIRNVSDYTQPSPIVDPGDPFGENFDTSWVYGPVYGRSLIVGGRYALGR